MRDMPGSHTARWVLSGLSEVCPQELRESLVPPGSDSHGGTHTGVACAELALGFQAEVSVSTGLLRARTAEVTDAHNPFAMKVNISPRHSPNEGRSLQQSLCHAGQFLLSLLWLSRVLSGA